MTPLRGSHQPLSSTDTSSPIEEDLAQASAWDDTSTLVSTKSKGKGKQRADDDDDDDDDDDTSSSPKTHIRFGFETGFIVQLYITAIKCRHPSVRRRALAVLANSWRLEGFWDSHVAVKMAERLIELEEEGAYFGVLDLPYRSQTHKLTYCQRVPEIQERRIRSHNVALRSVELL